MKNSILTEDKDRLHYFCCLVEYTARKTRNSREAIIKKMSDDDIRHGLHVAMTNACLSFEQVSDEMIEYLGISEGDYRIDENISAVYDFLAVGTLLQTCIIASAENGGTELLSAIRKVLATPIGVTLSPVL